jgi:type II protein arginine methyltransferase
MQLTSSEILDKGLALLEVGDVDQAETCFLDVLDAEQDNARALTCMARVAVMRGDAEEALSYLDAALELEPEYGDAAHQRGQLYLNVSEPIDAIADLQTALENNVTDYLGARVDLIDAQVMAGQLDAALANAEALLNAHPNDVRILLAAANAASAARQTEQATAYFKQALEIEQNDPVLWSEAAKHFRSAEDLENAWACMERALALVPNDPDVRYAARMIRTEAVPAWHFNMMNDDVRNKAFRAAIERQVKPGQIVLEIGTGAGLLAMMAARAGAKVYTCEANSVLAQTARALIAKNNLSDRITVIEAPSWEVEVGEHLPEPADVLIAEVFSAQFLSEEVIPTFEDAKARLLKSDALVIPASGSMVGALVSSSDVAHLTRVETIEGFDMSGFNAFAPLLMNLDTPDLVMNWLSNGIELLEFDFLNNDTFPAEDTQVAVRVMKSGLCHGVVQWLRLMLDDETPYENAPVGEKATRTKHWTPLFYPFPSPQELKEGQSVVLRVAHDRKGVRIELVSIQ